MLFWPLRKIDKHKKFWKKMKGKLILKIYILTLFCAVIFLNMCTEGSWIYLLHLGFPLTQLLTIGKEIQIVYFKLYVSLLFFFQWLTIGSIIYWIYDLKNSKKLKLLVFLIAILFLTFGYSYYSSINIKYNFYEDMK